MNKMTHRSAIIRRWAIALLLLVGAAAVIIVETRQSPGPYIDFNKLENSEVSTIAASGPRPLRLAISSVLSPKDSIGYYRQIASYLSLRLERPVILIQRQSYAEIGVLIAKGGADLAFFSSGAYASLAGQNGIELLAMQQRNGVPYYSGYIIVHKSSPAKSLADLQGRNFAFTDPLSFSGYIALAHMLEELRHTPDSFFSSYYFTYSHDKSLRAVASNVAAGAILNSLVYDYTLQRSPELIDAVRIIGVSPAAGTEPVVVRRGLSAEQKSALRQIFLSMHKDNSMIATLSGLQIDRFIQPQPQLYDNIQQMLHKAGREG